MKPIKPTGLLYVVRDIAVAQAEIEKGSPPAGCTYSAMAEEEVTYGSVNLIIEIVSWHVWIRTHVSEHLLLKRMLRYRKDGTYGRKEYEEREATIYLMAEQDFLREQARALSNMASNLSSHYR